MDVFNCPATQLKIWVIVPSYLRLQKPLWMPEAMHSNSTDPYYSDLPGKRWTTETTQYSCNNIHTKLCKPRLSLKFLRHLQLIMSSSKGKSQAADKGNCSFIILQPNLPKPGNHPSGIFLYSQNFRLRTIFYLRLMIKPFSRARILTVSTTKK